MGGKKKLREKERKEMEMKGGKEKNIKIDEKERKGMLEIERKWEDCNQNMEFDRQLIGKKRIDKKDRVTNVDESEGRE